MNFIRLKNGKLWHRLKRHSLATKCGKFVTADRVASLRKEPGGKLCQRCKVNRKAK